MHINKGWRRIPYGCWGRKPHGRTNLWQHLLPSFFKLEFRVHSAGRGSHHRIKASTGKTGEPREGKNKTPRDTGPKKEARKATHHTCTGNTKARHNFKGAGEEKKQGPERKEETKSKEHDPLSTRLAKSSVSGYT